MFSVVIPLYNKAHTIVRTLNTVLAQTYNSFEVIIVDDGSTDNGVEVITDTFSDLRLKIIHQENQGVSAARNNGVQIAQFEYIAFLDGDDEWDTKYLSTMKEAIDLHPNSKMFCCAGTVTANEREYIRNSKKHENRICEIDFFENPHIFLHTSSTIISKDSFYSVGGFPLGMKRNEDYAFFFSLALLTPVIFCGIPLAKYVGNVEGQATNTPSNAVLSNIVNRFELVYKNWEKSKLVNETFRIFTMYELRHFFIMNLRDMDYKSNDYLIQNLRASAISFFPSYEIRLYQIRFLRYVSILYLLFTKLRWRLRGYPYINY